MGKEEIKGINVQKKEKGHVSVPWQKKKKKNKKKKKKQKKNAYFITGVSTSLCTGVKNRKMWNDILESVKETS